MEVIAVINQRGGVGKTTTALSVFSGLRRRGYSVLFIDLDAQGNSSYSLGASTEGYNVMGVLERPETIREEIQKTAQGDVLASSYRLSIADKVLESTGKEYRLREALSNVRELYDYAVIDTPPFLGVLTINALTACDKALIPAQADVYSLQGIAQLSGTIETVRKYCNPDLEVMGVVLTRYNSRAVITKELTEMISDTAEKLGTRLFDTRIRECTAIKEAQAKRTDIYSYAPRSNASADYTALTDEIIGGRHE